MTELADAYRTFDIWNRASNSIDRMMVKADEKSRENQTPYDGGAEVNR